MRQPKWSRKKRPDARLATFLDAGRHKNNSLRLHVNRMSIVKCTFLCIGAVIWTLTIHLLAPASVAPKFVGYVMLAILPLALVAHVRELWRKEW
jgi:hypothetical protein